MKKRACIFLAFSFLTLPFGGGVRAFAASADDKMELVIVDNNPFAPSRGQAVTFRFSARDADRQLCVRVFTAVGTLVREFPVQEASRNTPYHATWDGRNRDGEIVARGIYLVSLQEKDGYTRGIVKKIAVVK